MWENAKTIGEVILAGIGVLSVGWLLCRAYYWRFRERFLFFSGCHLIPLSLTKALEEQNPEISKTDDEDNISFRPIIVLPRKYKEYFKVKEGKRVILRFSSPSRDEMVVSAKVYWFPDKMPWTLYENPALSLVLRRYFGIERPALGEDDKGPKDWSVIKHGSTLDDLPELRILHRTSKKDDQLFWLVSDVYSTRFWIPEVKPGAKYVSKWENKSVLEYSGMALKVNKISLFRFKE